jgi:uncharacterized membrane protein
MSWPLSSAGIYTTATVAASWQWHGQQSLPLKLSQNHNTTMPLFPWYIWFIIGYGMGGICMVVILALSAIKSEESSD